MISSQAIMHQGEVRLVLDHGHPIADLQHVGDRPVPRPTYLREGWWRLSRPYRAYSLLKIIRFVKYRLRLQTMRVVRDANWYQQHQLRRCRCVIDPLALQKY